MKSGIIAGCLVLSIALASQVSAELTECNGVWTNKPCEGQQAGKMTESHPTPRPQKEIDADQKRTLISELETRRLTVRGQYGIDVGISAERSLCANPDTTVTECAHAVNEKEKYFDERAQEAAKSKAREQQASDTGPEPRGGDTVTIIQNTGDYIGGRPYFRRTPRPIFTGAPDPRPNDPPRIDPPSPPPVIPPEPRKPGRTRVETWPPTRR